MSHCVKEILAVPPARGRTACRPVICSVLRVPGPERRTGRVWAQTPWLPGTFCLLKGVMGGTWSTPTTSPHRRGSRQPPGTPAGPLSAAETPTPRLPPRTGSRSGQGPRRGQAVAGGWGRGWAWLGGGAPGPRLHQAPGTSRVPASVVTRWFSWSRPALALLLQPSGLAHAARGCDDRQ